MTKRHDLIVIDNQVYRMFGKKHAARFWRRLKAEKKQEINQLRAHRRQVKQG